MKLTDSKSTKRRLGRYLPVLLTFGDGIIANLSLCIVLLLYSTNQSDLFLIFVFVNVSYILQAISRFKFHNLRTIGYDKIMARSITDSVRICIVLFACLFVFQIKFPLVSCLLFFVVFCILLTGWSLISQIIIRNARKKGYNFRKAIIIGAGRTAYQVLSEIDDDPGYGIRVIGIFDDNPDIHNSVGSIYKNEIIPIDKVRDMAINEKVNMILFALDGNDMDTLVNMMTIAEEVGAEFIYIPKLPQLISSQFVPTQLGDMHSLLHTFTPLSKFINRVAKRTFDLMVSIPFTLISPLIFIPIAIGIKMSSPGPVFFRQKRTGLYGKDFMCLKFRTMRVNDKSDSKQATKDDPRKTKFGNFLRRTSLDELPQFYNVLWGDMTVVGPRPHMVSQTEEYRKLINKYMIRHAVKPGITGWAQINGFRGATEELWQMEKRVEHDVWYISNWSVFLDIKIVFLTVFNQLKGEENAY